MSDWIFFLQMSCLISKSTSCKNFFITWQMIYCGFIIKKNLQTHTFNPSHLLPIQNGPECCNKDDFTAISPSHKPRFPCFCDVSLQIPDAWGLHWQPKAYVECIFEDLIRLFPYEMCISVPNRLIHSVVKIYIEAVSLTQTTAVFLGFVDLI